MRARVPPIQELNTIKAYGPGGPGAQTVIIQAPVQQAMMGSPQVYPQQVGNSQSFQNYK